MGLGQWKLTQHGSWEIELSGKINSYQDSASLGGAQEISAIIQSLIGRIQTSTIVRVEAVSSGGTGAVGRVDLKPLVMQLTASGESVPIATLHNVPYFRLQGGQNAVIIDPQVGDIGLAIFASRDISAVKRTKSESAPSSLRKYDLADGLYIGGFLNGAPEQYMHFKDDGGIKVVSTGDIEFEAKNAIKFKSGDSFEVDSGANTTINSVGGFSSNSQSFQANANSSAQFTGGGGISADGDISTTKDISSGGVKSLNDHVHSGVESGGSDTEKPTG